MEQQRTDLQNRSLHLFCKLLAEALNEAGISQRVFLEGLEVDNTPESIKSVFKGIANAKYLKDSTTELTTKEVEEIYDEINRQSSKIGIHIDWPTKEALYYKQTKKK